MSNFDPLTTSFLCTVNEKLWLAIFGVVIKLLQSSRQVLDKSTDTKVQTRAQFHGFLLTWLMIWRSLKSAFDEKTLWRSIGRLPFEFECKVVFRQHNPPTLPPNTTNQQHRCCSPTLKNRLKNYENCKNAHNDSRIVCISSQKFESWLICSHTLRRKLYEI